MVRSSTLEPEHNLTFSQVLVYHYHRFHDDYSSSAGGNLLGLTLEWVNLHLGSRERWTQIREIFWLSRCLVVLHCMDDVHSQQLPGTLLIYHVA